MPDAEARARTYERSVRKSMIETSKSGRHIGRTAAGQRRDGPSEGLEKAAGLFEPWATGRVAAIGDLTTSSGLGEGYPQRCLG